MPKRLEMIYANTLSTLSLATGSFSTGVAASGVDAFGIYVETVNELDSRLDDDASATLLKGEALALYNLMASSLKSLGAPDDFIEPRGAQIHEAFGARQHMQESFPVERFIEWLSAVDMWPEEDDNVRDMVEQLRVSQAYFGAVHQVEEFTFQQRDLSSEVAIQLLMPLGKGLLKLGTSKNAVSNRVLQIQEAVDLGADPADDMILASYFTLLLRYHHLLPYEGESRTAAYLRLRELPDQPEPLELFPELETDLAFAYHQEMISLLISGYTYRGEMPMSVALLYMLKLRRKVLASDIDSRTRKAVQDTIGLLGQPEYRQKLFPTSMIPNFVRVLAGEGVFVDRNGEIKFRQFRKKIRRRADTDIPPTMLSQADVEQAPSSWTVAMARQIARAEKQQANVIEPMEVIAVNEAVPSTKKGMPQDKPQRPLRQRAATTLGLGGPIPQPAPAEEPKPDEIEPIPTTMRQGSGVTQPGLEADDDE